MKNLGIAMLPVLTLLLFAANPANAAEVEPLQQGQPSGCELASTAAGERVISRELRIDGEPRELLIVLPKNYQPGQPHPLVFAFHGRTDTNRKVRSYFGLERASKEPTIFVYPAGTRDHKQHNHWWRHHDKAGALRDYDLFDQALALLRADYCVDPQRVYLVGHSLGATFVNSLGCARADQVRAIATVAGGIRHARCAGPIAALILHNPKDRLVKIADGEKARDWLLKNNGFAPASVRPTDPVALNCSLYGPDNDANPVVWCAHHMDYNGHKRFYPHNWPKPTAAAIFAFFTELPGA